MLILGKKGQIWTKKGPKWAGLDFSRILNLNFLREDHNISFYTKNQQNSTNCLEDISQNVDFGQKGSNLNQKGPIMGGARFFPDWITSIFQKKTIRIVSIHKIIQTQ